MSSGDTTRRRIKYVRELLTDMQMHIEVHKLCVSYNLSLFYTTSHLPALPLLPGWLCLYSSEHKGRDDELNPVISRRTPRPSVTRKAAGCDSELKTADRLYPFPFPGGTLVLYPTIVCTHQVEAMRENSLLHIKCIIH